MKLKNCFFAILCIFFIVRAQGQSVQSPSDFLGYELGTRFTRHHKVVDYFKYVSKSLSNVKFEKYGETNEFRPLFLTYLSSQKNIDRLDEIRKNNLQQTNNKTNASENIAIVWLSYNVHGNEASATESAMKTLYELVTSKKEWLDNTVVIVDPCLNPDGRDRYVNWYNQVKSSPYDIDKMAIEHNEPWPRGRPNHYLFDLNRDWAWASQEETKARLKVYHRWLPHIHVDFHEQGMNAPYYFAPAAEPFHEVITDWQRDFQTQIGKNHIKYFDKEGWLYFTKEHFDLFYPSYGDTYPTYLGAIGMTYEQAGGGAGGLGVFNNEDEILTLKNRIKHHTVSGLSTVEIASQNAGKLNAEFKKFFNNETLKYKSYVLKNDNSDKISKLKALLDTHHISYGSCNKGTVKGYDYSSQKEGKMEVDKNDLVINTNQPKGKMIKALFEPNAKLSDSLTYDITAWSLPYAHGIKTIASKTKVAMSDFSTSVKTKTKVEGKAYAYLSKWNSINDAKFLSALIKNNIRVRFSEKDFKISGKKFSRGSLIILRADNQEMEGFDAKVVAIANNSDRTITPAFTGFVELGKDFGSNTVKPINKQKVAVLTGDSVSSLGMGEVWHFFEKELEYPLLRIDTRTFSRVDLQKIDVLILPNGTYKKVIDTKKLKSWVQRGGTVIAIGHALKVFANKKEFALKTKKKAVKKDSLSESLTPYNMRERKNIENLITGSIFESKVDITHPLAFGYNNSYFSLKLTSEAYAFLPKGSNVAYFNSTSKNVAGFAGNKALKKVPESLLFGEERVGRGSIVYMVDNPLFRSFWENGKLFFVNAVFMVNSDELRN
ncbi:M14 family metallopeptidase [Tenacibaculum xiamenense]|uniref:M14 family metallopeptidase n=1 Tax=Tenacibaculum xiamenense TaxID=1261553 RepID=UPI0038B655D5